MKRDGRSKAGASSRMSLTTQDYKLHVPLTARHENCD
jgi:hypothetical protein